MSAVSVKISQWNNLVKGRVCGCSESLSRHGAENIVEVCHLNVKTPIHFLQWTMFDIKLCQVPCHQSLVLIHKYWCVVPTVYPLMKHICCSKICLAQPMDLWWQWLLCLTLTSRPVLYLHSIEQTHEDSHEQVFLHATSTNYSCTSWTSKHPDLSKQH